MNNLMYNYFVNLNKIKKQIEDIKLLGFNTDHLLQELNNINESVNQELNKTNNDNSVILITLDLNIFRQTNY